MHSQRYSSCDACSYNATNETDLKRHKQTMHGGAVACDKCEIKCTSTKDLDLHLSFKHGLHYGTRYFNSQSRRNEAKGTHHEVKQKNNSNKPSANQAPVNTQDEAMNNDASQNDKDDESAYEYFKCQQSCPALQKVFSSIDELELHTKYFHTPSPCRDQ